MTTAYEIEPNALTTLEESISGTILLPCHDLYDAVRRVHNGLIDKRPAIIVQCIGTADVVESLAFAIEQKQVISVRGGGHNVAGRAVCNNGVMIDLSLMKGMHVNAQAKTITVQPGVTWGELNRETQLHGLATPGGMISSTGVAGLTLGGGLGALMPKYGLTIDNLISAEVVTVSGEVLTANSDQNHDLFWAIRGGGGNFGIVTSFEFQLHQVGPIVEGGLIVYPENEIEGMLTYYRKSMTSIGDELSVLTVIRHHPDASGALCAAMFVCHCGEPNDAKETVNSIKCFGAPVIDQLGPISYTKLNTLVDSSFPRLAFNYWKSSYIAELTDEVTSVILDQFRQCPSQMSRIIIDHFHGEVTRPAADSTAYPNRSEGFYILIISQWQDKRDNDKNIAWAKDTYEKIEPFAGNGVYSNYLSDDEMDSRIQAAFGQNYSRLQKIKAQYDPDNLLRLNQNITPLKQCASSASEIIYPD